MLKKVILLSALSLGHTVYADVEVASGDKIFSVIDGQLQVINFDGSSANCATALQVQASPGFDANNISEITMDTFVLHQLNMLDISANSAVADVSVCYKDISQCFVQVDLSVGSMYVPCIAVVNNIDKNIDNAPDYHNAYLNVDGNPLLFQADMEQRGNSMNWSVTPGTIQGSDVQLQLRDKRQERVR